MRVPALVIHKLNKVHKFKRIVGKSSVHDQFKKTISHYKRVGYGMDIMRQSACLV